MGAEITNAMITNFEKSLDIKVIRLEIEAPRTFRIPISFIRCSAVKEASPNNPKPVMKMASKEKKDLPVFVSF